MASKFHSNYVHAYPAVSCDHWVKHANVSLHARQHTEQWQCVWNHELSHLCNLWSSPTKTPWPATIWTWLLQCARTWSCPIFSAAAEAAGISSRMGWLHSCWGTWTQNGAQPWAEPSPVCRPRPRAVPSWYTPSVTETQQQLASRLGLDCLTKDKTSHVCTHNPYCKQTGVLWGGHKSPKNPTLHHALRKHRGVSLPLTGWGWGCFIEFKCNTRVVDAISWLLYMSIYPDLW